MKSEPKEGTFGKIFTKYRHDSQGAIARLKQEQGGEAVGALTHPELGDIDLVWGEAGDPENNYKGGYGLAKIIAKHPEVVENLQEILSSMEVKRRSENRAILESKDHKAAIGLNWLGDKKQWMLSAYAKESKGDSGTIIHTAMDEELDDSLTLAFVGSC